ncbi:MAG: toxin-antitoxin system HicB family antitoxin [Trueperaceae bacterium]|nr:toxin-antitoxin system HicB family antitoxin [Trueperaceae bacterium]
MRSDITRETAEVSSSASGRFLLRLDPSLHEELRTAAEAEGVSLNTYCIRRLASPTSIRLGELGAAVARAVQQFGNDLTAVVAYGSWARGEAKRDSDIDLLIVLRTGSRIVRSLYHPWDDAPLTAYCLRVEPSIVALPPLDAPISGLWAEVAIDGIVLFDPDLTVSRHLAEVRRRVATGEISKRWASGQPYWVRRAADVQ